MVYSSWRLPPIAAAFTSGTASFLEKIKRNSGFDLNRPPKVRPKNLILGGRFFNGKIQF